MLRNYLKKFIFREKNLRTYHPLVGSNVTCPCCKGSFITFLPFGLIKRANAQCPQCFSLERHRLHWLFFEQTLSLFSETKDINLLHVAPETIFFNKFSSLTNINYYPIAKIEEGFPDEYPIGTKNGDLTKLNFSDNSFDIIYCSHVLEHIIDDKLAMQELFRVLKPNGTALLQVPLDKQREVTFEDFTITTPDARERLFGQADHVRIYGKDYIDRLRENGFNVEIINYRDNFSTNEQFQFGLMLDEDLYVCKKS